MKKHEHVDQFEVPRNLGILQELSIEDPMYDITTEDIAHRVLSNKTALELKFKKKSASQNKYYDDKGLVNEVME